MRSKASILAVSCLLLAGCGGSSHEGRQRAREAERQRVVAESREELSKFANRYSAEPVDLFEFGSSTGKYTAQLQNQLEGRTIAFRSELRDIFRLSETEYQVFLGNPRFGGNIAVLTAERELAERILKEESSELSEYLITAHVDRVTPIELEVNSCNEEGCSELELASDLRYLSRRISGRIVVVERAK